MQRTLLVLMLVLFVHQQARSQYASSGTGSLRNEIWWFDWAGFTVSDGASRTFNTTDGIAVTISFSAVSGSVNPDVMNTWYGAILHLLYDFTDPAIRPALHSKATPDAVNFTMSVTASRGGSPIPFTFVAADAEASAIDEVTTLTTNGSNWQSIDLFRNSSQGTNPLTGCNTQTVSINQTYGNAAQTGQNPILITKGTGGALTINVEMNRSRSGGMAVAFGILAPVDRGDLPASYGAANHQLSYSFNNSCNYLPPLPYTSRSEILKLGTIPGDADGYQTTDDNAIGVDEDAVTAFPVYDGTGSYSLSVALHNTTGTDAWLTGWFDYNRNGQFESIESITALVASNATSVMLTWTGLPPFLPVGTADGYGFRLRISSDKLAIQIPAGFAKDGEVEDYFVKSEALCSIQVRTNEDTAVCSGQPVQLNTTGASEYSWNTHDYLSDAGIADPVARPETTTVYIVTGKNLQACIAKDTITISVLPQPVVSMSNDVTICPGAATQLSASSPGATVYSWWPQHDLDNATVNTPIATPAATTRYKVTVQGSNGCLNEGSVTVTVRQPPVFTVAPAKVAVCLNDSILLTASGGDDYTWLSKAGDIIGRSSSIMVRPVESGAYRVQIRENVCLFTQTLHVPVTVNVNTISNYPVPSAFTPNNDGKNDCFGLKYWGPVTGLQFEIFNRWGQRVFSTSDPAACWNGTYNGTPQLTGGYTYQIKAANACGVDYKKGIILLIR